MSAHKVILATEVDTEADRTSAPVLIEGRGAVITAQLANVFGTPSYQPSIEIRDPDGNWVTIWSATTALTANGDAVYVIYPGASGGDVDEVDGIPLPKGWRFKLAYTGTPSTDNADTAVSAYIVP